MNLINNYLPIENWLEIAKTANKINCSKEELRDVCLNLDLTIDRIELLLKAIWDRKQFGNFIKELESLGIKNIKFNPFIKYNIASIFGYLKDDCLFKTYTDGSFNIEDRYEYYKLYNIKHFNYILHSLISSEGEVLASHAIIKSFKGILPSNMEFRKNELPLYCMKGLNDKLIEYELDCSNFSRNLKKY